MNQEELINSIKQLREIKPRKEWAVLVKSQISLSAEALAKADNSQPSFAKATEGKTKSVGIMDVISSVFFQKKLAYAFAVVLFLIVGVFGFAKYTVPGDLLFPVKKIAEQSQAALTGQNGFMQSVATLNNRINDLAQVAKDGRTDNIPSAISEVSANAKDLVKNMKDNLTKDPETLKVVANSLKTLADVSGTDLTVNPDVEDLYHTVVSAQIVDLQRATLSTDQKNILARAEDLYNQGKYADALEEIMTINN